MAKLFKAICIFSLISFGFFSCSDKKHHASLNEIEFADIQLDTIAHLFNDTTKPCCDFKLNFTYPSKAKDEAKLKLLQEIFIQDPKPNPYPCSKPNHGSNATPHLNTVKSFTQEFVNKLGISVQM